MCGALALDGCGDPESPKNPSIGTAGTTGSSGSASESGGPGNGSAGASAGNSSSGAGATSQAGSAGQNNSGGKPAEDGGGAGAGMSGAAAGGAASHFSFFATSFAALRKLSGNEDGFGGDLRFGKPSGLEGADEICRTIAETSMPGNGKTWRAFLSVTKGPDGNPVNAIDRVGEGPWYDRRGRLVTMNKAGITQTRPEGADPIIADDLPNEDGVPNHDPDGTGEIDNHNFLTGSTAAGLITGTKLADTCQDWTSAEASGGKPRCGVSWPRAQLINWISVLNEGGCAPGVTPAGAQSGTPGTVGALGGYGGFYCFALTP
jgi:hypothetical protein